MEEENFMQKKLKSLLLATLMLFMLLPANSTHAAQPIHIVVNGYDVKTDVQPFIENSRTLVPIRFISEALGYQVKWNGKERSVTITDSKLGTVVLFIDKQVYKVNGENKISDVAPMIRQDRTFVPLRFVAESFDFNVDWIESSRTVTVNEKKPVAQPKQNEKPVITNNNQDQRPIEQPKTNTNLQPNYNYNPPTRTAPVNPYNEYFNSLKEQRRKYEEKQKKIDEINESARAFERYMEDKLNELKRTHPGYVYNYYDYLNEPEYERTVRKKIDEIVELEQRINLVSLDDSYKAKGEVIRMKKKLNEKQEELDQIQERHAYALAVDGINEQLKEYREKVRQAIREVENS